MDTFLHRLRLSVEGSANIFKNIRLLFYASLFLLLLIITAFGIFLSHKNTTGYKTKAAGNGVTLSLIPTTVSAPAGTDFTVTVALNTNDTTVSAAELHLSYDSTKLQAKSITSFGYLPVTLTPGTLCSGTASITLGSQPTESKKGAGILATLTFTSFTSLPSRISFASNTQVAAIGQTGNTIDTMDGTDVNENVGGPSITSTPTQLIHCGLTVCKTGEECYPPPVPTCPPGKPCILRAPAPYCRPTTMIPTSNETGITPVPTTAETPAPTTASTPVPSPAETIKPCQWYDWPLHFSQCIQGGFLVTVTPLTTPAPEESPITPSPLPTPPGPVVQHLVIQPQSQGNDQITIAPNAQQNAITGKPIPFPSQNPQNFVPPPITGGSAISAMPLPTKTLTQLSSPPQQETGHPPLLKPITGIGFIDIILHAFGFGR